MMREAVQQRGGHLGIAKDAGPFAEAEVCRDDDAGAFVELAEQMEQHRTARGTERQVPELVEDNEIGMDKPIGDLARSSLRLLLLERVDQLDGREEPDTLVMMLDGLNADCRRDVRLARAGTADQDNVVGVVEELAAVKLAHERLVDLAAGKIEAI